MSSILAKVKGEAEKSISSVVIRTWEDLKKALVTTYSDKRDVFTLVIEMSNLKQNNETPFEFLNNIQNYINLQASYLATHNVSQATAIQQFVADLGLRVLLRGLKDPLGALLRTKDPKTINEALNVLVNDFQIETTTRTSKTSQVQKSNIVQRYVPPMVKNNQIHNFQPFYRSDMGPIHNHTANRPDYTTPNYFNKTPTQPAYQPRQFAQRPGSNTYRSNRYNNQNVWTQNKPVLPRPTPMSGVSRNTNLNITENNEPQYPEQEQIEEIEQNIEQIEQGQEFYEDIENFQIDASEIHQTL